MAKYQDPKVPFVPDRTVLPIHEPEYAPCKEMYNINGPVAPPRFMVDAPKDAPNVVIFLLDDMGYGASSAFGGPCSMPAAERLAKSGMRFNRFHTTSVCAPTRAALLSGYNHHSVNMGNIGELGTAFPGNLSTRPKTVTPMAKVLKENGYSTAQFGKCHETPVWEATLSGPLDHWPVHSGFDKFYGFLAAETNQYRPALVDGLTRIEVPDKENYHLTEDLADQCIQWMYTQKTLTPDKPFFVYFAPGATHAPHQAPPEYRDMFKGAFDCGWDVIRERTLENMKKLGIAPPETELAHKPASIRDWDVLSDDEKMVYAREMEIYAGFARHVDDHIARVVDTLEDIGILDDTLIFYILGDNGASGEGLANGCLNENSSINHYAESIDYLKENLDKLGTEMAYNHYSNGWCIAMDTPFTWCKYVAGNFGGTRNGMICHYPAKFAGKGEVHPQFSHVIDIAPTVYELCNIPHPTEVNGVAQRPIEGTSFVYAMTDKDAQNRHKVQYFNISANVGIYHDDWFAGALNKIPWEFTPLFDSPADAPWELYNLKEDFSCANDLAEKYPEKLEELKKLFFEEGVKHNVFPMETRTPYLHDPDLAHRPTIFGNRKEITMREGFGHIGEQAFLNLKNKSFSITAEVEVCPGHTDGVIFAQGGRFGGYSLYIKDGVPCFCYNFVAVERYYTRSPKPLTDERNQIRLLFSYDGGGACKGGSTELYVNGELVAKGRVENTNGNHVSFDETADVGIQHATPVTEEYTVKTSKFQGRIYSVKLKIIE